MWVGAVLTLVSTVGSSLTAGQLREKVGTRLVGGQPLTSQEVNATVTTGLAIGAVLGTIGVLLWVLMA